MKQVFKIFFIIILINNMPYSQIANLSDTQKNQHRYLNTKLLSIVDDFSKEGDLETLNAEVIKKIARNTYWVKNAQLLGSKNEIILELGLFLRINGNKSINQIPAVNGYVIELVGTPEDWRNLFIWLADENGEKDSDFVSLEFNKNFTLLY